MTQHPDANQSSAPTCGRPSGRPPTCLESATSSPTRSSATGRAIRSRCRARRPTSARSPSSSRPRPIWHSNLVDSATVDGERSRRAVGLPALRRTGHGTGRAVRDPRDRQGPQPRRRRGRERHPLRPGRSGVDLTPFSRATGTPAAPPSRRRRRRRPSPRAPSASPAGRRRRRPSGCRCAPTVIGPIVDPHGRSARCS